MEAKVYDKQQPTSQATCEDSSNEPPARRRRNSTASSLKDVWFTWYTKVPRMWSSTEKSTKHTRSTAKLVVACMKLFTPNGFNLDEKATQYSDQVLASGESAEAELLSFLREHSITARGAQNVLKSMRTLHKSGHLNEHIRRYEHLQATGRIVDPAPTFTQNIIDLV